MLSQRFHLSVTKLLSHLEIIEDLDSDYEKQQILLSLETHLMRVFSRYISQNPRGKSNNSIPDLNTLQHEKQGIISNTSLKASIESGNLQSYDEQSIALPAKFQLNLSVHFTISTAVQLSYYNYPSNHTLGKITRF